MANISQHANCPVQDTHVCILPLSITKGAFGPTSIATAPAPPDGRAFPAAYTAISAQTTIARRPRIRMYF